MNKKISLGLCISLIIISITATFAITMVISKGIYNSLISNISQRSQTYNSVDEISRIISNYFLGSLDDRNLLNASLAEGYVDGLGDPNSKYLTASEYTDYTHKLEGGVRGVGIETAYDYQSNKLVITHVYKDSPAESSGLKERDVITAISDVTVMRSNYEYLTQKLYGNNSLNSVEIEYERNGETSTAEPALGFSIPSIRTKVVGKVGYIKIGGFYKNTPSEFEEAITSLNEQGVDGIVFDVRNTTDGSVEYAAKTLDILVSANAGTLATAKDKNGEIYKNKIFVATSNSVMGNFAVLVNSYTAGPAELFATDLRAINGVQLIGTKTAGVGTMQEIFTLESGGAVLLTVAYIEPKGGENSIYNNVGIMPDHIVTLTTGDDSNTDLLTPEQDLQLTTAVSMLTAA